MKNFRAASEGYAVCGDIKEILMEEGYAALRIIPETSAHLKLCEAKKVNKGSLLPKGADTVLEPEKVSDYGPVVLIEESFTPLSNVE